MEAAASHRERARHVRTHSWPLNVGRGPGEQGGCLRVPREPRGSVPPKARPVHLLRPALRISSWGPEETPGVNPPSGSVLPPPSRDARRRLPGSCSTLTFGRRWWLLSLSAGQEGLGQQKGHSQDKPRGQGHPLHGGVRHGRSPSPQVKMRTGTGTAAPAACSEGAAGCADGESAEQVREARQPRSSRCGPACFPEVSL